MEKLIEYEKKLTEAVQGWGEDALFVFRGHANEEWKLDSGADRRLRQQETEPGLIEYLEKSLLEPARHEGHGRQQNKELNDLELLAALQHNGAATCLIDFTTNFHIALWFACREEDKKDGKVFVVNRGGIHTFEEVTPERATKGIKEFLQEGQSAQPDLVGKQQKVYYWKPPPNENRIITQHSCFLFSPHPIEKGTYREIIISKDHKKCIQNSLQRYYGLEEQAVFRDFIGFAHSQSQSQPIKHKTSVQWFQSGNRHFQRGEFEAAITDYGEALRLNPLYADAYTARGLAKGSLGQHEAALVDLDEALRLNPQDANAYMIRGTDKFYLRQYEETIADCDAVLTLKPQYATAYTIRGLAKSRLGRHRDARTDVQLALELATEQGNEAACETAQRLLNNLPSGN